MAMHKKGGSNLLDEQSEEDISAQKFSIIIK